MKGPRKQYPVRADGCIFYNRKWRTPEGLAKIRERGTRYTNSQRPVRYQRRKEWIEANGPCARCGCTEKLIVDHVDPRQKRYAINTIWGYTEEIRSSELAKCQVLCASCHSKKTIEDIRAGLCGHNHAINWSHCKRGHELNPENLAPNGKYKMCRACRNIRQAVPPLQTQGQK